MGVDHVGPMVSLAVASTARGAENRYALAAAAAAEGVPAAITCGHTARPGVSPPPSMMLYPFVGNIIINGNTVTRRKIPVSMLQDTGVIIEKGSGQYNHWEVLTLALHHRNVRRLDTLTSQGFHLHLRRDSM